MSLLDQSKTVTESALQFIYAAKESAGNSKAIEAHKEIDEAADGMRDTLKDLMNTMDESASAAGVVTSMVDDLARSLAMTDECVETAEDLTFVDYQTSLVSLAKQIARHAQDIVACSGNDVGQLGNVAKRLTTDYHQMAEACRGAVATTNSAELGKHLKLSVQELGNSCIALVRNSGQLQANPTDTFTRRDLSDSSRKVNEKVSKVLASLQAGSRGTQACIHAGSTIAGIIGDLDTTIMFATAGTLNADGSEQFGDHRETILKTAKSLVEDTKTLVAGAASNQEQLANAAQNAVMTITRLADGVKQGAASLGSEQPEAQVLLINAVKDVAGALSDLISATKYASGKPMKDPSMGTLRESAKIMVTNVKSLLETVKTVEDEAARGTRALESTIEAISQELRQYVATDRVEKKLSAEDLIRATKPITIATAKAVAAGNSGKQEDVIVAANMGRKAIHDLLRTAKGAAFGAENHEIKRRASDAGRLCGEAYKDLLEQVNFVMKNPSPQNRQRLAEISKKVAESVTQLLQVAEAIKGSDWVDPDDPIVIAESQLLGAANSIEAAARKLETLQPRRPIKEADESLSFEEQIVEAAKSIAAATGALIKAATAAQRELVAQGKVGSYSGDYDEDSQWSQGLIFAAKEVAAATQNLCDAANAMVQGHASEEKLVSSAKLVASNTAKLLVACRVKADPDSVAMRRLQGAGNAVKRATDALVKAAIMAKGGHYQQEEVTVTVNQRMVGGMAQIINAQEAILRKERELEEARKRLETIYKAKYKKK